MGFLLMASFASGCATVKTSNSLLPGASEPRTVGEVIQQDLKRSSTSVVSGNSALPSGTDIVINGVKLKNKNFDIPVTINSRVEYWVDYFTGRGRPFFTKYLERSEFFIPYIAPLLKQNGLPEDLVYLSMIESGFNNLARSHAKAVGPWQFISATGKRYGLMVNWWVDERRDIRKSTLAAVEYLRDLYGMFQSWELAAASYNAGEAKVARAIQRFGTKDFWVIAKHRFLRPETRDYVPKIIAAALISKNREQFGFPAGSEKPAADEAVAGDGEIVKVIKTDKPLEDSPNAQANGSPALINGDEDFDDGSDSDDSGPGVVPATLTLPIDNSPGDSTLANNSSNSSVDPSQPLAKPVSTPHVSKSGEVGGEELAEFEVQSPADLLKVARAAGLSYTTVKSLNPELLRWCTPPTVGSYRLKLPASTKDKFLTTYNHEAFPRKVQFLAYKVHRGETLSNIALHYGIKVDPISDLNGVSAHTPLRKGVAVLIPIPNDRSRSLASLDVRDPPEKARRHRVRRRPRQLHYSKVSFKRRQSARATHPSDGST